MCSAAVFMCRALEENLGKGVQLVVAPFRRTCFTPAATIPLPPPSLSYTHQFHSTALASKLQLHGLHRRRAGRARAAWRRPRRCRPHAARTAPRPAARWAPRRSQPGRHTASARPRPAAAPAGAAAKPAAAGGCGGPRARAGTSLCCRQLHTRLALHPLQQVELRVLCCHRPQHLQHAAGGLLHLWVRCVRQGAEMVGPGRQDGTARRSAPWLGSSCPSRQQQPSGRTCASCTSAASAAMLAPAGSLHGAGPLACSCFSRRAAHCAARCRRSSCSASCDCASACAAGVDVRSA